MGQLASKSLAFACLVGLTVMTVDAAFTLKAGIFEPWAVKTLLSQLATGLSVAGWSLIGAVSGVGLTSRQGRYMSWSRTVLSALALGAIGCAAAVIGDRIFDVRWGLLFGYDGIAWVEVTFLYFILWWAASSFVMTLLVARRAQRLPPNTSFERTRER